MEAKLRWSRCGLAAVETPKLIAVGRVKAMLENASTGSSCGRATDPGPDG
jgi:hypothetical protein